jgi:hypothetical protein
MCRNVCSDILPHLQATSCPSARDILPRFEVTSCPGVRDILPSQRRDILPPAPSASACLPALEKPKGSHEP